MSTVEVSANDEFCGSFGERNSNFRYGVHRFRAAARWTHSSRAFRYAPFVRRHRSPESERIGCRYTFFIKI